VTDCDWSRCELTVANETRRYSGREAMAFDDSYVHSARNDSDVDRVVLLLDVWNPELSEPVVAKIRHLCMSSRTLLQGSDSHFDIARPERCAPDARHDYLVKTLCLGDPGVGKSRLVLRMADLEMNRPWREDRLYDDYISSVGLDFKLATYQIRNVTIKLQCWDVSMSERFCTTLNTTPSAYYRGAHIIFLLMDTTDTSPVSEVLGMSKNALIISAVFTPP
jgi:hypothetical protein